MGAVVREIVWLGNLPVAIFQASFGSSPFYIYADNLGTPRAITSSSGQLVWKWDGEPFGVSAANSNPSGLGAFAFNLRFAGQYFDAETGYHHNGWREYDPAQGRYVQTDPIGLEGGLNTYAYALSNPLGFYDASGQCPWCVPIAAMLFPEEAASVMGAVSGGVALFYRFAPQISSAGIAIAEALAETGIAAHGPAVAAKAIPEAGDTFCRVVSRVAELGSQLKPAQQGRVTLAVGLAKDSQGAMGLIVGTSEKNGYLREGVSLLPGELMATGSGHAEANIAEFAKQNRMSLLSVGATRPICSNCENAISSLGAIPVTPLKRKP